MASIVIAAGGTGGHIYPGLALAEALQTADPDGRITFIGTPRGLEQTLIPQEGYDLRLVGMVPFSGWRRFVMPVALIRAALQTRRILRAVGADAVAGMGGYPTVPVVLAARLTRTPSVVHASGAVVGLANKLSARFTPNVALSFERAVGVPRGATVRTVGMPISGRLSAFDRAALRDRARSEFAVADDQTLVIVNGGSQGSVRLNAAGVGLAARWKDRDDVRVVVKAGRAHADDVAAALDASGATRVGRAVAYFDDMDTAYAAADIAITRAGAATVAELTVTGLPAVLVPYPFRQVREEQTANARVLVDAGAALLVADEEATADRVGPMIEGLMSSPAKLAAMSAAARGSAHPQAAATLAAWVLELAERG